MNNTNPCLLESGGKSIWFGGDRGGEEEDTGLPGGAPRGPQVSLIIIIFGLEGIEEVKKRIQDYLY